MGLRMIVKNEIETPKVEVEITPTTAVHIRELTETIREGDKKEITSYGYTCAKGLWRSYKRGLSNKTALIEGRVAAVWGVGGAYLGEEGAPWLLTSCEVKKISPLRFARIYQREVKEMLKLFPKLANYVDANYPEAIRLLQIVGFEVGEPMKYGRGIYRPFSMEAI